MIQTYLMDWCPCQKQQKQWYHQSQKTLKEITKRIYTLSIYKSSEELEQISNTMYTADKFREKDTPHILNSKRDAL